MSSGEVVGLQKGRESKWAFKTCVERGLLAAAPNR